MMVVFAPAGRGMYTHVLELLARGRRLLLVVTEALVLFVGPMPGKRWTKVVSCCYWIVRNFSYADGGSWSYLAPRAEDTLVRALLPYWEGASEARV